MEDVRRQEVRELARLTAHLTCEQQTFFQAEYGRHRRNPTTALLLCILLGDFGAHYFYFGRHRRGVVRLLFCWTLVPWIMALFEARTITSRALRYNASLANELMLAIKLASEEHGSDAEVQERVAEPFAPSVAQVTAAAPDVERAPVAPLAAAALAAAAAAPVVLALDAAEAAQPAEGTATADEAPATGTEQPEPLARVREAADAGDELDSAESHLIAAAWAGREPSLDDPSDPPLPLEALEPYTFAKAAPEAWVEIAPPMAESGESNIAATDIAAAAMPTPEPFEAAGGFQAEHAPVQETPGFIAGAGDTTEPAGWSDAPVAPIWSWPAAPADPINPSPDETSAYPAVAPAEQERSGQESDDDADALPWFVADATPRPAVSAAAALAAAAWANAAGEPGNAPAPDLSVEPDPVAHAQDAATETPAEQPTTHPQEPAAEEIAPGTREPVLMYQIAALPRRESVHMMPPPARYHEEETLITAEPETSHGAHPRDDVGLAAVGSALAAGLAELLRERSGRPTSPLTTPVHTQYEPGAPAEQAPPVAALPSSDEEGSAPWQRDWTPTDVWVSDMHAAAEPAPDQPATALPADTSVEWPALAPPAAPAPIEHAQVLESDQWENEQTVRGSTVLSPAETYISTPSRNLRRRVMQRVIVRKMAVLDGHVVAESTAERQVAVVPDEQEMSARVQASTTEAAREALQQLMELSPEEVRPSIRMQLYALDTPVSVQNFHMLSAAADA